MFTKIVRDRVIQTHEKPILDTNEIAESLYYMMYRNINGKQPCTHYISINVLAPSSYSGNFPAHTSMIHRLMTG